LRGGRKPHPAAGSNIRIQWELFYESVISSRGFTQLPGGQNCGFGGWRESWRSAWCCSWTVSAGAWKLSDSRNQ